MRCARKSPPLALRLFAARVLGNSTNSATVPAFPVSQKSDSPSLAAWQVLRRGPFARYMAGETISMLGTWMQQMAQGWVVAGLTTSAFTLGLMNFASGVPMLVLTT